MNRVAGFVYGFGVGILAGVVLELWWGDEFTRGILIRLTISAVMVIAGGLYFWNQSRARGRPRV